MKKDFIFNDVNQLKGVGPQLSKYLIKKKIEKIKDIFLNLPYSEIISFLQSCSAGNLPHIPHACPS